MYGPPVKDVVLSYAPEDRPHAVQFRSILQDWFQQDVWLRDFDLEGGQLLLDAMEQAVSDARWFILLLTRNAAQSAWVQTEANLATFRAIEDDDFKVLILAEENVSWPRKLRPALAQHETWRLAAGWDPEDTFLKVANYVGSIDSTRSGRAVYVNRGDAGDRFAIIARRSHLVAVVGLPGIGKSAFCLRTVAERLHKRALVVRLSRGHSLDLLARQVLQTTHSQQPAEDGASDVALLTAALEGLGRLSDKFYLVLDNAEEALDIDGKPLTFLSEFLLSALRLNTHVVLTSTRVPQFPLGADWSTEILRLDGLADLYVKESIDQWLEGSPEHDGVIKHDLLNDLVRMASGHPLAAKLIASHLKARHAPEELLTKRGQRRFELRLADYLLKSMRADLTDTAQHVLRILAVVAEPMTNRDLYAAASSLGLTEEAIDDAIWQLSERLILERAGDLISLHRFIMTFVSDELLGDNVLELRESIARSYANYAFERATQTHYLLQGHLAENAGRLDADGERMSNIVFRYAVPASKLLRTLGEVERAQRLPMQVKGTLRELVFYFYQIAKDYGKALEYADRWLRISPNDLEVMLYQARCHRNTRTPDGWAKAEAILDKIEAAGPSGVFRARVLRERALIAESSGDVPRARRYFEDGIALSPDARYPENHVGMASLLLRETDENLDLDVAQAEVVRAVSLLEQASQSSRFDRFYLGQYIEALVRVGRERDAYPLLQEALERNPADPRLNYWSGEAARRQGRFDLAVQHGRRAIRGGVRKGAFTVANALCSWALVDQDPSTARVKLKEALEVLSGFVPEFGTDNEVAAAIKAKTSRLLGDWDSVRRHVAPYEGTDNPYTAYEQTLLDFADMDLALARGDVAAGRVAVVRAFERLTRLRDSGRLSPPLEDLRIQAERRLRQTT